MRTYFIALLLAATACGADSTTPTASGVFPAEGFTGRNVRVEISGDATMWKDGATVDFGAGVTVNSVEVASPTDLFAEITIDPAAAAGKTDVTVTNSGKKYTLAKAFELVSPTPITFSGDVAQGGVPFFTIENLDFTHQFDVTQDQNTGEYTGTTFMGPPGSQVVISSISPFEIQGNIYLDTDATPGPLMVTSGSGSNAATSEAGTLDVKPRTPTPFTSPITISLAEQGSSALYSFTTTGQTLIHYTLTGTAADSTPVSEVLGTGGTWAHDTLGASPAVLENGGTGYLLVESFGMAADTVTLTGVTEPLVSAAEGNDTTNNTAAGALAASAVPFRLTGASISSGSDNDYVKFVAPTGSTGKHLHVVTTAGADAFTDTAVDIFTGTAGATHFEGPVDDDVGCSFLGCSNYGEDFATTATLTAGQTYWIKVSAGQTYGAPDVDYVMILWLE